MNLYKWMETYSLLVSWKLRNVLFYFPSYSVLRFIGLSLYYFPLYFLVSLPYHVSNLYTHSIYFSNLVATKTLWGKNENEQLQ